MAQTVRIPGIGNVPKPWLYAGIAATLAIIGVAYYRRQQQAAAVAAAPFDATTSEATSSDFAQFSDAAGYNTVFPSAYSGQSYSPYGYDIYGNPLPAPTGAAGAAGVYATNNDWANAAQDALDPPITRDVSSVALSRVLGGLTVTSDQQAIFLQALGRLGPPPQGYPQPIRLSDTPAQPAPTPPTTTLGKPAGLRATGIFREHVDIAWTPVPNATGYRVSVNGGFRTTAVYAQEHVWHLRPNTRYTIGVQAQTRTGPGTYVSGPTATISVRTHK